MDGDAGPVQPDEHRLGLDAVRRRGRPGGGACPRVGGPDDRRPPRPPARASTTAAICRRAVAASAAIGAGRPSASAAAAAPKASRAGSASSPARRPRSCSPPTSRGSNRLPRRTISAPAPGTPPSLCALMLTRSASSAARSSRHVAAGRGGVDVDGDAGLPAQRDHLVHGLERPDFVVAPLAVHQRGARKGARLQALAQRLDLEPSRAVHGDVLGRRQACRRVTDRGMLHGGAEDGQAGGGPGRTPDGRVDGLGRARGEDHLAPRHAHQFGHLAAGHLERVADGATLFVQPARVPGGQGGPLRQRGERPRAAAASCWRGRDRRAPRGLRRTRCRRRRPAPARRGSPGVPGATPFRTAPTAAP